MAENIRSWPQAIVNTCMDNQLTVADIASVKSLIEAGCARGTFRANEMTQIGQLYDKVIAFLNAANITLNQQPLNQTPQGDSNA